MADARTLRRYGAWLLTTAAAVAVALCTGYYIGFALGGFHG